MNKRDLMGRWVVGCCCSSLFVLFLIRKSFISPNLELLSSSAPPRRTPLHYAAANGRYQCTVTLVNAGAEVNEPDQTGCTPLHYCAASQAFSRFLENLLLPTITFLILCLTYQLFNKQDVCISASFGTCLTSKRFCSFSELIVIFPATIRTTKMRQRSRTCESLPFLIQAWQSDRDSKLPSDAIVSVFSVLPVAWSICWTMVLIHQWSTRRVTVLFTMQLTMATNRTWSWWVLHSPCFLVESPRRPCGLF